MKMDITTHNGETILQVKHKILTELETFCNEKLKDTILPEDLKFFFQNSEISPQNEQETLESFVEKV